MGNIIHIDGEKLEIKGATKVVSSTKNQAVVELSDKMVVVSGQNMEVKRLNLDEKEVDIFGVYQQIKFVESKGKGAFLKKIFK